MSRRASPRCCASRHKKSALLRKPLEHSVNNVNVLFVPSTSFPLDTSTKLLHAAREALLEGGLAGFSMRRVASACGVSATAIYRHYEDKDALLSAAVVSSFRTFSFYLMSCLHEPDALARFRHLGQRYFDFAREHPHDYQLIFMTPCAQLGLTKLDQTSRQQIGGTFQLLQDRVAECQAAGLFRAGEPRSLAAYIWASYHGLASLFITGNLGATEDETTALVSQHTELVSAALRG